jgi:siroheme decarboxylase
MVNLEKIVLKVLQRGVGRTRFPYEEMAKEANMDIEQLLCVLREWKACGKLRRIGAIVNHFKAGLGAGAMVVWLVPQNRVEEVGKLFASFEQVSHAYERVTTENWSYNVYTMIHAADAEQLQQTVQLMSAKSGIKEFEILITEKELKKVPPTYVFEN